jgi:hypothetical protein
LKVFPSMPHAMEAYPELTHAPVRKLFAIFDSDN